MTTLVQALELHEFREPEHGPSGLLKWLTSTDHNNHPDHAHEKQNTYGLRGSHSVCAGIIQANQMTNHP